MRTTTSLTLLAAAALAVMPACTVKDVNAPAVSGPSTFGHSIVMVADRDTLTQNGVDFTDIRITSLGPNGQSETIPVRAQIQVDGVEQDFGSLSTKSTVTPTTIRYTAPATPAGAVTQIPTTVTIALTPSSSGDFRGEQARQLDIRLVPQGVILPTNPNLVADFTVSDTPKALQPVTFDGSKSTFNGAPCLIACGYSWNFGDGTTGTGIAVNHTFRALGATGFAVTLTVTDPRGAQATKTTLVEVAAPELPKPLVDVTPASPVVGQDVFFSAARTTSPSGRTIVSYAWDFGDGVTGAGTTTSHRYTARGVYQVTLKVTDDAGVTATSDATTVTVSAGGPTVDFTVLPASPRVNQTVTINITAAPTGATTISSYSISWGDGSPVETTTTPTQSHTYGIAGQYVITVTATDSLGHSTTTTKAVTIS